MSGVCKMNSLFSLSVYPTLQSNALKSVMANNRGIVLTNIPKVSYDGENKCHANIRKSCLF